MGLSVVSMIIIGIAYYILSQKMKKSEYKRIQKLQKGTKTNAFSSQVLFQKLYLFYSRVPFLKRYILKLRRKLEIINIQDEYATRRDSAKIITKALAILLPVVIITILLTNAVVPILPYLLSFAAGAMIYVVVEELIPEAQSGEHSNIATIGVAIGFVIMMILDVALG